jgi:hypothetical protein
MALEYVGLTNDIPDGAFYVDHATFGKLPDVYTQHRTYLRLFTGSVRVDFYIISNVTNTP